MQLHFVPFSKVRQVQLGKRNAGVSPTHGVTEDNA